MRNSLIKPFITIVAVAVIGVRAFRPDITVSATTVMLVALAVLPWLSSVIKSFEVFGMKFEFQNRERTPARKPIPKESGEVPIVDRGSAAASAAADPYFDRLIKVTPVELVVAFILTNAMVTSTGSTVIVWANFLALAALTPFFLWRVAGVTRAGQLIASTVVFIAWGFALGGPFASLEWWTPLVGALVLAIVTLMIPLLKVG